MFQTAQTSGIFACMPGNSHAAKTAAKPSICLLQFPSVCDDAARGHDMQKQTQVLALEGAVPIRPG